MTDKSDSPTAVPTSKSQPKDTIPFWCVNVPPEEWEAECPEYLSLVSEKDKGILATSDEEYRRLSWEEVKELVDINRLDLFRRVPSDLRGYRKYVFYLLRDYGSVMNYILWEKLKWQDLTPSGAPPFENIDDYKILPNDWPYGIDKSILHLVVWVKFKIEEEPERGDLTPKSREMIDEYVGRTFRSRMKAENVTWFKNWTSIKSVKAVEHFHVMLYEPDVEFVREITRGAILDEGERVRLARRSGLQ